MRGSQVSCGAILACSAPETGPKSAPVAQARWALEGQKGEHIYETLAFLNEYLGRLEVVGDERWSASTQVRRRQPRSSARFSRQSSVNRRFQIMSDNSLVLANALHKAELLVSLLRQAGCDDVSLESRTQGAPHAHIIRFAPCQQVQQGLAISTPAI